MLALQNEALRRNLVNNWSDESREPRPGQGVETGGEPEARAIFRNGGPAQFPARPRRAQQRAGLFTRQRQGPRPDRWDVCRRWGGLVAAGIEAEEMQKSSLTCLVAPARSRGAG